MSRTSKIRSLNKINEKELKLGITGDLSKSWHQVYNDSAWIYIGGLDYELNEGDIIAVFSQYGEIVNVNLVRDSKTGKSKGFAFLCYQDQRSTILAVDNFNGTRICNRPIQVDHCNYKAPKFKESIPEEILKVWEEGCAPQPINIREDDLKAEVKAKKKERKSKLKEIESVLPIDEKESKEIRKARKRIKKEQKAMRKLEKRERERMRSSTPDAERGHADDEGRWDAKKKRIDDIDQVDDDQFYGASNHFNFSKKRKEQPTGPTYNARPDFDKADWRDIEMFKVVREHERRLKGETGKPAAWKEEEHYVPQRLNRGK